MREIGHIFLSAPHILILSIFLATPKRSLSFAPRPSDRYNYRRNDGATAGTDIMSNGPSADGTGDRGTRTANKIDGLAVVDRLKKEPFNVDTETRLFDHPYLAAARAGTLTLAQRQAFALEQYGVQLSDATSFAALSGNPGFVPSSLAGAALPDPVRPPEDLFRFLLGGEVYAAPLLLAYAEGLGLDGDALHHHRSSARAQAYPSYWARIALAGRRAAGAAACAANFPAWGKMCASLLEALSDPENGYGYDGPDDGALAFVKFFATPIENLDNMAAKVLEEEGAAYEDLVEHVRLLQEYEILFWDAIFDAK